MMGAMNSQTQHSSHASYLSHSSHKLRFHEYCVKIPLTPPHGSGIVTPVAWVRRTPVTPVLG